MKRQWSLKLGHLLYACVHSLLFTVPTHASRPWCTINLWKSGSQKDFAVPCRPSLYFFIFPAFSSFSSSRYPQQWAPSECQIAMMLCYYCPYAVRIVNDYERSYQRPFASNKSNSESNFSALKLLMQHKRVINSNRNVLLGTNTGQKILHSMPC